MTAESETVTVSESEGARVDRNGPLPEGATLGRYVVVNHIASGGAGSVYAAYDTVLDRRIALKLLIADGADGHATLSARPGWDRLVREARMLAKLNHPHVVAVYDAGEVDDQAYLAMEFVEGSDLARWIALHRAAGAEEPRSWRAAVQLVREAGRGLVAAHEASLVHGDFKPANVLVDPSSTAKVSDFGIARVGQTDRGKHEISHEGDASEGETTRRGWKALTGTPAYMAPEQFEGHEADVRTDIYSFCATMFEAVYGVRPHRASRITQLALAKSEGPPPRPAGADAPSWIYELCARGLAPRPENRPESVQLVLDELDAGLRPSRWPWVLAGVGGVVGLGVAGWAVLRQPHPFCADPQSQLEGVWDDARRAAVESALLGTGYAAGPEAFSRVEGRLDAYAVAWMDQYAKACNAAAGAGADEMAELAFACLRDHRIQARAVVDALSTIDDQAVFRVTRALGRLSSPTDCSDPDLLAAERSSSRSPESRALREDVSRLLAESAAKHDLGQYADSLSLAEQAQAKAQALDDTGMRARVLHRVGVGQAGAGEYRTGRDTLLEAYYLADEHGDPRLEADIAIDLADAHGELEDSKTGLHWIRIAKTANTKAEEDRGVLLVREAELVAADGENERAIELLTDALRVLEQEGAGGDIIAATHNDLGNALRTLARYEEALEQFEEARRVDLEALGAHHPNTSLNLIGMGGVYLETGRFEEAADVLSTAVDELSASLSPEHPQVAAAVSNLAIAYAEQGDYDGAVEQFRRATAIEARSSGERSLHVARTRMNIGITLMRSGRYEEALSELEDIRSIFEETLEADHPDQIFIWSNLGDVTAHLEDWPRSLEAMAKARDLAESAFGTEHPLYIWNRVRRAEILVDAGRTREAIPILEDGIPRLAKLPGEEGRTALARFALARALHANGGEPRRIRALAEQARAFMASTEDPDAELIATWISDNAAAR